MSITNRDGASPGLEKQGAMELRQLRYFVEIADQRSFTRASESLAIAQPALTTQIHKLEAEFGAPLFVRGKRGITLTDVGSSVLEEARRTLAAADATARTAALAAKTAAARVVLGYTSMFPFAHIARVIAAVRGENLGIDLRQMWSRDQIPAVRDGAIDLALVQDTPDLATDGLVRVPMAQLASAAALPTGHRLANRTSTAFGESAREETIAACRAAGFTPRVVQETDEIRILLGLIAAGLGVSIVHTLAYGVRVAGVQYVTLTPPLFIRFAMFYRRDYGRRVLGPLLARLDAEAHGDDRVLIRE
jgi:DNA-binding transcriptional LysR family regulator